MYFYLLIEIRVFKKHLAEFCYIQNDAGMAVDITELDYIYVR